MPGARGAAPGWGDGRAGCVLRIALADQARVGGHRDAAVVDVDLGGILVDAHRLADQALGDRVAIGVDRDVAVQVDHALEHLVDRRQHRGQRLQVRLLDHVGRLGRHAEHALGFGVGDLAAPGERLAVEIVEVGEAAPGQEVALDIGEGALDPPLAIGMADPVGAEARSPGVRAKATISGAMTASAPRPAASITLVLSMTHTGHTPVHEARGLEQEVLGLEAGEARVILDEQAARVGQHQAGTLGGDGLVAEAHAVRRGVVLHLLARREVVFAGAPRRGAQPAPRAPSG